MLIRLLLIFSYIYNCFRLKVEPWKFFQINAPYFNEQRNLFSKLDMDQRIPRRWRLEQFMDMGQRNPTSYPAFVKPEWGQNSQGIARADNLEQLQQIRQQHKKSNLNYIIQHAAPGKREFEVFIIPNKARLDQLAVLSITETCNRANDPFPINGVYNQSTYYKDQLNNLSLQQQNKIWSHLQQIGNFRIARYGVRADSIEALVAGDFHIIEINVYVPMPLILLVNEVSSKKKIKFVLNAMQHLAAVTKTIPASQPSKSVFFKKLQRSRILKSLAKNEIS
ncbi:MAG: hypothetical protein V7782_02560 [Psychromonas sp.]